MGVDPDRRINLAAEDRRTVLALLDRHLPGVEAWVYGSRAKRTSRPHSDLDLVVFAAPEQRPQVGDLREAFEESNLPFRVDLFVWNDLPKANRKRIEANHVVLVDRIRPDTADLWHNVQLGHLVDIYDGPDATPKKTANGPIFLGISNLASGRLDLQETEHLSEHDYLRWTRRVTPTPNDIVFSYETRLGEAALIPEGLRACLGRRMGLLRPRDNAVDSRFLLYAFLGEKFQETLRSRTIHGSTVDRIPLSDIADFPIEVPRTIAEQRAIAHVLGTLDDKIELHQRMNATLEAMVRALFRSWFVDFDPVRAKMAGRDTGLPKEIADLFPDRLVDSELGEIPEGWDVSEIGAEVDAIGGGTPSTKEPVYWNGGQHCWATPKDLSKLSSPVLLETDRKITDAGVRKISSGLLPRGTVLLSSRAPIGYLAITEVPTAINQGFIAMICQKRLPALYLLSWCHENLERIKDISGGSTFAEISKKAFRPLPVMVPSKNVLGVYDEASRSLHDRVVSNTRESALLVPMRDALLPKLVSGEIRLAEAGEVTEAVS